LNGGAHGCSSLACRTALLLLQNLQAMETNNYTFRTLIQFAKESNILARKPAQIYPLCRFKIRVLEFESRTYGRNIYNTPGDPAF
jgi:hypothetical protein